MVTRAVDNQVFMSMCSPARDMNAGYHAVRTNPLQCFGIDTDVGSGVIRWWWIQCMV